MTVYKTAPLTSVQSLRLLGNFAGTSFEALSQDKAKIAEAFRQSGLTDKRGTHLIPLLENMAEHGDAVLICNLGQDDPCSAIDEFLSENCPELLAAGLALLAKAAACTDILLYAPEKANLATIAMKLLEKTSINPQQITGETSLVLREDTALYSVINTGVIRSDPAEYDYMRTYMSEGWKLRPTLVVDGETACQAACILADPYGTPTKLMVLNSGENLIAEVRIGTPLQIFLDELGFTSEKAPLLGGLLGRFVSAEELTETKIAYASLFDSLTLYHKSDCMANVCACIYAQCKEISCGKCTICREGSWHLSAILSDMTAAKGKREELAIIEDIGPIISEGALCAFGKNLPNAILSALNLFRDEIEAHIVKKTCPSNTCEAFLNYVIDPCKCTGCGACLDVCKEEAIEGEDGYIHMIEPKFCVKCGNCSKVCVENAVIVGGPSIRIPKKLTKVGQFR